MCNKLFTLNIELGVENMSQKDFKDLDLELKEKESENREESRKRKESKYSSSRCRRKEGRQEGR